MHRDPDGMRLSHRRIGWLVAMILATAASVALSRPADAQSWSPHRAWLSPAGGAVHRFQRGWLANGRQLLRPCFQPPRHRLGLLDRPVGPEDRPTDDHPRRGLSGGHRSRGAEYCLRPGRSDGEAAILPAGDAAGGGAVRRDTAGAGVGAPSGAGQQRHRGHVFTQRQTDIRPQPIRRASAMGTRQCAGCRGAGENPAGQHEAH